MNNKQSNFICNTLQVLPNQKTFGLGNQVIWVGEEAPLIGGIEEINNENLQINRLCDVNDVFKQYTCLFTNILGYKRINVIEQLEQGQIHAIIQKNGKQIIFPMQNGEIQQEQQKKQTKQKQDSPSDQLTSIIQQIKSEYKEQLSNVGKILQFKHPPIIDINFVFSDTQTESLRPYINNGCNDDEFEFVSYHLSETNSITMLNNHIKQLIAALKQNKQQIFYFNDKSILPINKFNIKQKLFKSDLKNNRRLLVYKQKFNTLIYSENNKLFNVHHYLSPKALENGQRYLIRGDYAFHHYMQDGFDDKGWGCAYRSFQSVLSWLMENGYTKKKDIPNHKRIQQILVEMGDKPVDFVGTSDWIGAFEVSMLITQLTQIDCKILNVPKGTDVVSKLSEFKNYFENYGAPIMFGGGLYAYTLLGIEFNDEESRFLILDPHFTANDTIKSVIEKQGISWKKADLFEEKHFYNFCMPLIQ